MKSSSPSNSDLPSRNRLIIVSNRLPVVMKRKKDQWHVVPGSGGLVTAMAPVLKDRGGLWIGWSGTEVADEEGLEAAQLNQALADATREAGFSLKPVHLSHEEIEKYYFGFSNEIIWPQFHDLLDRCKFDCSYWPSYMDVNRKFAEVIIKEAHPGDYIWVHDYHLMMVAQVLHTMGSQEKIGFFLHIPFPPLDIFMRLPWRFQLLRSLLYFDLIGFQTLRDRRNFRQCVQALIKEVSIYGKGQVVYFDIGGRHIRVGAFPISIDFNEFSQLARDGKVTRMAERIVHEQRPDMQMILGIDRLDYTKGIPERIQAFGKTLQLYPELQGKVTLVQVVVPSRYQIPEYQELRDKIERLISEINGRFGRVDWIPIHYFYRSLTRPELVAYYRAANILLITSLKDGMNLIAKEYCAATVDSNGVLILSEFAGATAQMQNSVLLVNPHDQEGIADAIYNAVVMSPADRQKRMKKLRTQIKKRDIYWWVNSFLKASIAKSLNDFNIIEDYQPRLDLGRQIPERRRHGNQL